MTLSNWIEKYCEDNNIELPSGIPDEKTALEFLKLNSSGGGGGGDSDFSTAEVTIEGEAGSYSIYNFRILNDGLIIGSGLIYNETFTVPLYKGKAVWALYDEEYTINTTGNISYDTEEYEIIIEGDGTITIS